MTHGKLATFGLAGAILFASTPALAGNGGANSVSAKAIRTEQLGPKYQLHASSSQSRSISATTRAIPITLRTLVVEELGPKYLLGR